MRRLVLWGPPVAYMAVIFYVSGLSDPLPTLTKHVWDKLLHAVEYLGLAVLFARALAGEGMAYVAAAILAVVLASAYAATDEYHQSFVPGRSAEVADLVADACGAAAAAIAIRLWSRMKSTDGL